MRNKILRENDLMYESYIQKLAETITSDHMRVYNVISQNPERFGKEWLPASPAYIKQQLGIDVGVETPEQLEQILNDLTRDPRIGPQFHVEHRSQGQMFFKFEPKL